VPSLKLLVRVTVVAFSLFAAAAHAAPASAATPCWKALLNDWYDGRIDHTYAVHCYQDALHHLPADVQTYSSAHDDIERALASAKAKLKKSGTKITSNTKIPPGKGGGSSPSLTTSTTPTSTTTSPGRKRKGGLTGFADKLNPSSPTSLPVPLLVLGALAILLVAAGGAGLLAKRYQGRNPGP
jgi:lysozyme family protein